MSNELMTMIKTVDFQIDALTKVKIALVAALAAQGHVVKTPPAKTPHGSLREYVIDILRHAKKPLTAAQLADAAAQRGWKTVSANPRGLMGVELRKFVANGEVKRAGKKSRPRSYRLGTVIERPAKLEPWQKKLTTAEALVRLRRPA